MRNAPISSAASTNQKGRGPFAVLKRAKNIATANETERDGLLIDAERLESWAAGIVLGAIVLEAVVWVSPLCPLLFKLGNFIADAGVAIGVYGEMRFGHVVSDILKFRLADALTHAAEAQEQLRKFRTSRRELLGKNPSIVTERLKQFAPIKFDTGLAAGPGEPMHFLWDLDEVLRNAGWEHIDWPDVGTRATSGALHTKHWLNGLVWADDVEIHIRSGEEALLGKAATELVAVLNELDIAARWVGFNTHSTTPNTMHILIGLKQ